MDLLSTGVLGFAAGVIIGAGLLFWLLPARRQAGQLIRDRDEARHALEQYRSQVDEHFVRTAELVNDMTHAYRSVHEHLSGGAQALCSETGKARVVAKALHNNADSGALPVTPPLDYAPSAQGGTLAEDFGLQQKKDGPFEPVDVDTTAETESDEVEVPRDYAETAKRNDTPNKSDT